MSIDYTDDLNKAYLEGLEARLQKKIIKLGEIIKQLGDLEILHEEVMQEITVIKKTITHAQNSDN